jgi:glycosylphosphatidylinositol deacylase
MQISGVPVLFVPGNRGSFKQIRSIASTAAVWLDSQLQQRTTDGMKGLNFSKVPFDFFSGLNLFADNRLVFTILITVDFNEEFSGVHGGTLLEQSEYLNDVIRFLLNVYYPDQLRSVRQNPRPLPTSVILIGHSMVCATGAYVLSYYVLVTKGRICGKNNLHFGQLC